MWKGLAGHIVLETARIVRDSHLGLVLLGGLAKDRRIGGPPVGNDVHDQAALAAPVHAGEVEPRGVVALRGR